MQRRLSIMIWVALIAILTVVMLGALGCGGSSTTTTAAGSTTSATTAVSSTTTAASTTQTTGAPASSKVYKVGISVITSHPVLDAEVVALKKAMADQGFVEGQNVQYDLQNANGDMSVASSIAQKFAGENLDLIFTVTTPSSQAMAKAVTSTPIVFVSVTDPVAAGLLKDLKAPEGNITGISDLYPVDKHLALIQQLVPKAKTLGLLYNAGEANSVALVEKLEKPQAEAKGYKVITATASNSGEVQAAAQSLVGRVDAISVLQDNTVVSALEAVIKVGQENKIPVIVADSDSVKRGGVAAYGQDPSDIGGQAGIMGAQILKGASPKDIPVGYAKNLTLTLNQKSADLMGVTFPDALKSAASQIF